MKKEHLINFRCAEDEAKEFMQISKAIDVPFSQLAREAIREKIAALKKTHPRLKSKPAETIALGK